MNKEINLAWMYPDILNLHGERGNVKCFERVANQLNIPLNIERIDNLEEKIDFSKYDILIFNAGELKVMPAIIRSIEKQKKELDEYIDNNKYIIATGTTGAMFADSVERKDNTTFKGLDILDMNVKERTTVIGDDLYYKLSDNTEILGSQIQMIDVVLKDSNNKLAQTEYGYGNNGNNEEGAKYKNVIYTNCLGPVFVKNPWFAESILRDVCKAKEISISADIKPDYEIELASLESTKEFINKKISGEIV